VLWPHSKRSCIEWKGLTDDDGYGRVKRNGIDTRIHRAFFEIWYGVVLKPEDVLLHSCDNPRCFSPYHLTKGTQLDNVRDMDAKGRRVSGSSLVTHCPEGHEYTVENTVVYKDGKRRCKTCMKAKRRSKKSG
jgi:hypothetical protein